jgi:hypothetical protein
MEQGEALRPESGVWSREPLQSEAPRAARRQTPDAFGRAVESVFGIRNLTPIHIGVM